MCNCQGCLYHKPSSFCRRRRPHHYYHHYHHYSSNFEKNSDRSVKKEDVRKRQRTTLFLSIFLFEMYFFQLPFCYVIDTVICAEGRQPSLMHSKQKRCFISLFPLHCKLRLNLNGYEILSWSVKRHQFPSVKLFNTSVGFIRTRRISTDASTAEDVLPIFETPSLRSSPFQFHYVHSFQQANLRKFPRNIIFV